VALGMATSICCFFSLAFLVSFLGNRSLENKLVEAAQQVPQTQIPAGQLASLSDLQKLDALRQSVATLSKYQTEGPPLHLRWGLYVGDRLYPQARELYFARFHDIMFGGTQQQLVSSLRALPDSPGAKDAYEKTYNVLKAYLITTSNPDRSSQAFLSPVLLGYWAGGHDVDPARLDLAKQQFAFYSTELLAANPYSSDNDAATVTHARTYLSKFAGIDRYYFPLLSEAARSNPSVNFSRQFKDAADVVVNRYEVKGAFTKGGFAFMQKALTQPSRFLNNEEWVVGRNAAETLDANRLQQELAERYRKDFISEWRNMLKSTSISGYSNLHDAEVKLGKLSSPSSPLLELFWFFSHNTDVNLSQINDTFQPVRSLEPPGGPADKFIQPSDEPYVTALTSLQSAVGLLASSPSGTGDVSLVNQTLSAASEGEKAVGQMSQKFLVDPDFHIETLTQDLLAAPIRHAETLIKLGPKDALNGAGKPFCSQFSALAALYPFNRNSSSDLPLAQFSQMFAPGTGNLWAFYDSKLKTFLSKQGSQYVTGSTGSVAVSPAFVSFFNHAAAVTDGFYPAGTTTPHFTFTLKELPGNVDGLVLKIGNETLSGTGQSKTFTWTGAEDVLVTTKSGDILASYTGPWAVFHFVADAHSKGSGSVIELEWILQNNGRTIMLPSGKPKSYSYELQVNGFNPLRAENLAGIRCVAEVAR
jgi:type VI secretion system protein ImpL